MDATGLGVTPEQLTGAAAAIDAAVRGGEVAAVPTPAGGPDYGHPGAAEAVARFGAALRQATVMLQAGAEGAATGLRAGASAYLAQEQAALRAVGGTAGGPGMAGAAGLSPEQAGLAGLLGVPGASRVPGGSGVPGANGVPGERRAG